MLAAGGLGVALYAMTMLNDPPLYLAGAWAALELGAFTCFATERAGD